MLHKDIEIIKNRGVILKTYVIEPITDLIHESNEGAQKRKHPAIIILPGGAFQYLSDREAEPVALTFAREGFHTFVLNYSVGEKCVFPNPLDDISMALYTVRKNAVEWNVDENKIAVGIFGRGMHCSNVSDSVEY